MKRSTYGKMLFISVYVFFILMLVLSGAGCSSSDTASEDATNDTNNSGTDQGLELDTETKAAVEQFLSSVSKAKNYQEYVSFFDQDYLNAGLTQQGSGNIYNLTSPLAEADVTVDGAPLDLTTQGTERTFRFTLAQAKKIKIYLDDTCLEADLFDSEGLFLNYFKTDGNNNLTYLVTSLSAGDYFVVITEYYCGVGTYSLAIETTTETESVYLSYPGDYVTGSVRAVAMESSSESSLSLAATSASPVIMAEGQYQDSDGNSISDYAYPWHLKVSNGKVTIIGNQRGFDATVFWARHLTMAGVDDYEEIEFWGLMSYSDTISSASLSVTGGLQFEDWDGNSLGTTVNLIKDASSEDPVWYDCPEYCNIDLSGAASDVSGLITINVSYSDSKTESRSITLDGNRPSTNGTISITEETDTVGLSWNNWELDGMVSHENYVDLMNSNDYSYINTQNFIFSASGTIQATLAGGDIYWAGKEKVKFISDMFQSGISLEEDSFPVYSPLLEWPKQQSGIQNSHLIQRKKRRSSVNLMKALK